MDTKRPTKKAKTEAESLLPETQSSETNETTEETPQEPKTIDTTKTQALQEEASTDTETQVPEMDSKKIVSTYRVV
ncbi:MAG: hypothetical protein K2N12_06430 [Helicobacter sp.]|nr:hypothetical protein [Helicobacter sp.]